MKNKITIALDEKILWKIDREVENGEAKNRSAAIESHLVKFYGDFALTSAIIFAHDNKWDNRPYPFSVPKSLLAIRWKNIISRQIDIFLSVWITDIHMSIPKWDQKIFESTLKAQYPQLKLHFYELDEKNMTGNALQKLLETAYLWENLVISNGDIFYGNLDLKKYLEFSQKKTFDFAFCLKFVMTPEQLWNVIIQWENVIDFVEKPKAKPSYLTNSGLYITTKKFLEKNNLGESLEKDFFPYICKQYSIWWFLYSGEWEHIQNDSTFERVNWELL